MAVVGVVGGQWGDEGKGKVIDLLAQRAEVVIRSHGGNNAGHTVVNELGKFALHLVPAGIFNPATTCIVGPGVVLDPAILLEEVDALQARGVSTAGLRISNRAHLVMPYHLQFDRLLEESRGSGRIGTTGRGIGPAYADKVARDGLRVADLLNLRCLRAKLERVLAAKNVVLTRVYGQQPYQLEPLLEAFSGYAARLEPYVREVGPIVFEAVRRRKNVLLEGAHGTMLDPDHGTYPYVTSSHPVAGGACIGAGVGPTRIDRVIGVVKAYTSRVGDGPFPTELHGEEAHLVRERGHEYGTTTGRPRRVGWLDTVMVRYAALLSGLDGIAITRLDVLAGLPRVRVAVAYRHRGGEIEDFPSSLSVLRECEPVYEELPGWPEPPETPRSVADLHPHARRYVEFVQRATGVPVVLISIGRERGQTISLAQVFEPRRPAR